VVSRFLLKEIGILGLLFLLTCKPLVWSRYQMLISPQRYPTRHSCLCRMEDFQRNQDRSAGRHPHSHRTGRDGENAGGKNSTSKRMAEAEHSVGLMTTHLEFQRSDEYGSRVIHYELLTCRNAEFLILLYGFVLVPLTGSIVMLACHRIDQARPKKME
jgi:hypothetical protein